MPSAGAFSVEGLVIEMSYHLYPFQLILGQRIKCQVLAVLCQAKSASQECHQHLKKTKGAKSSGGRDCFIHLGYLNI